MKIGDKVRGTCFGYPPPPLLGVVIAIHGERAWVEWPVSTHPMLHLEVIADPPTKKLPRARILEIYAEHSRGVGSAHGIDINNGFWIRAITDFLDEQAKEREEK